MTFLCAAAADQVSVNPGAPSADGQQYITTRSLLQSNAGPSFWSVTIHARGANAQAVQAQVAQLAAMPTQQLASVLRSHGEALWHLVWRISACDTFTFQKESNWSFDETGKDIRVQSRPSMGRSETLLT